MFKAIRAIKPVNTTLKTLINRSITTGGVIAPSVANEIRNYPPARDNSLHSPIITKYLPRLNYSTNESIHIQPNSSQYYDSHNINHPDPDNKPKEIYVDSVLRKRRLKMKKHKLRKRRRAQRALKKRLGKL